jgi:hypothetical protein
MLIIRGPDRHRDGRTAARRSPAGTRVAITLTRAPTESPSRRSWSIAISRSGTRAALGAKNGLRSASSHETNGIDDAADLLHAAADARAVTRQQPLLRHRAGRHHRAVSRAEDRPPPRGSRSPYLRHVRVVRVSGTEGVGKFRVVLAARILVADQQRDRRAGGHALVHAGQDLDTVGFAPLRHMARRAGPAPVEIVLQVLGRQRQPGRAAVDHAADRRSVRLAEVGDLQEVPEGGTGHVLPASAEPHVATRRL